MAMPCIFFLWPNDAKGANTCTGGCATAYYIFFEASLTADMLSDRLSIDDFGSDSIGGRRTNNIQRLAALLLRAGRCGETQIKLPARAVGGIWFVAKTGLYNHVRPYPTDGFGRQKLQKIDYTPGSSSMFTDWHEGDARCILIWL